MVTCPADKYKLFLISIPDHDLSVLSMSVMGFQKKVWMGEGGVSSIQFYLGFLQFCVTLQSPWVMDAFK